MGERREKKEEKRTIQTHVKYGHISNINQHRPRMLATYSGEGQRLTKYLLTLDPLK